MVLLWSIYHLFLIQLAKVSDSLSLIIILHTVDLCILRIFDDLKFIIQVIQFNLIQMVYTTSKIRRKVRI